MQVSDPYQWLEENSEDTRKFISDQNECTHKYLETLERKQIHDELVFLWKVPKFSSPILTGDGKKYFKKNDGRVNHKYVVVNFIFEKIIFG